MRVCAMVRDGRGPRRKFVSGLVPRFVHSDIMFKQVCLFFRNQRLRFPVAWVHSQAAGNEIRVEEAKESDKDMPVELDKNPFEREKPVCILCKYNIKLEYKNVRLLSQFVSSFTGKVYDRHVTGICERQQQLLVKAVKKARSCGLMAYYNKKPSYMKDPLLFDPEKPFRPHKY